MILFHKYWTDSKDFRRGRHFPICHVEPAETSSRKAHIIFADKFLFSLIFQRVGVWNPKCKFPLSSGVFPITVPPYKGTHGARIAGDNTQHSHRKVPFTHYATTLCAPATQQHGAVARTYRQARRSMRSPPCGSNSVFEVAHSVYKYATN